MLTDSIDEAKKRLEENDDLFKEDMDLVARCLCPFPYITAVDMGQALGIVKAISEDEKISTGELADRVSTQARVIVGLFQALEQMNLAGFDREGDTVWLTPQGRRVLTPGGAPETVEVYLNFYRLFRSQLPHIGFPDGSPASLPQLTWPPENEQHSRNFEKYMAALSPYVAAWLDDFVDWSRVDNLLDVGGGNGTIVGSLCQKHPHLRARLFNLPAVEPQIRENMEKFGVTQRARFIGGDFLTQSLPSDNQVVLFSRVLCDWDDDVVVRLLTQCRETIQDKGFVCICDIVHQWNKPWDSDPWFFLWKTLVPGYWQYGSRSLEQWEKLFKECGLKLDKLKMSSSTILKRLFLMTAVPV